MTAVVSGRRIAILGTVQGVGFRPWVYRLATQEGVAGSVRNDSEGVTIDAFGPEPSIERFLERLTASPPPAAAIRQLTSEPLVAGPDEPIPRAFTIEPSTAGEPSTTDEESITDLPFAAPRERRYAIPPDLATCQDCMDEVFEPDDRRYRYPFTNCTSCGPRFTITLDLPYDRPATTMGDFEMCRRCQDEYEDALDRRFHAQPNACAECGPRLELLDARGETVVGNSDALLAAALAIRRGQIVAVKGLGGFHLIVLASNQRAVERLRQRKHRWQKPLAVMAGSPEEARRICQVLEPEAALLSSPEAPIVLLPRLPSNGPESLPVAEAVAPGNPRLGVMLPSTPLHHLLLANVRQPVVATSGNLSDEPICIRNDEALERLRGIADLFLVHDRPIARHADDSVVLFMRRQPRLLRRARGYAPRALELAHPVPPLLAVGAHMKNAVAVGAGRQVVLSQHIGDMETPQAVEAFERVIADLLRMLDVEPVAVVHDLHPDYPSTQWAKRVCGAAGRPAAALEMLQGLTMLGDLPTVGVQHHHAHLASCLADNSVAGRALGITFDGTGYGTDGTVWGGEALLGDAAAFERVARLRPFRLPGGEVAVREPRRVALAVLVETFGTEILTRSDLAPLADLDDRQRGLYLRLLESGLGSPWTSSAGRLFDAVAALVGLHQKVSFEGQAAMSLEFAAATGETRAYPIELRDAPSDAAHPVDSSPPIEIDWRPMVEAIVGDLDSGVTTAVVAARFHNTLAAAVAAIAGRIGEPRIALTGGCFQNVLLTERTTRALEVEGFEVLLQRQVPANDGGIALGQIAVAAARLASASNTSEGR